MTILFTIIAAILAIFFVVLIHECGHLFAAKAMGVKVERFSIGFGKVLFSIRGKDTEYALSLLPLGGYVKMLGEDEGPVPAAEQHRAYNRKSILARMFIVLAGPLTNFLLALVVFWVIYLSGTSQLKPVIGMVVPNSIGAKAGLKPKDHIIAMDGILTPSWQRIFMILVTKMGDRKPLKIEVQSANPPQRNTLFLDLTRWSVDEKNPDFFGSLGIAPYFPKIPPVLESVQANSPAWKAGLKAGDRFLNVNGKPVEDWMTVAKTIQENPKQKMKILALRNEKIIPVELLIGSKKLANKEVGFIGAVVHVPPLPPELLTRTEYNVITAWGPAFQQVGLLTSFNALVLYKIVAGNISPKTLGGPISVFHLAGQASQGGWMLYLGFIAFISIALGFVNLLPIPGLDGGHFLFLLIEAILRRPLPERIQVFLIKLGILLILTLIVYATYNDMGRLFS